MAQYKRILLKLSGESLMGGKQYGIDEVRLNEYAAQIKEIAEMGVQIGIVIGGGNIFRGLSGASKGFDRVKGDQMGMLATVINSLALSSALVSARRSIVFTKLFPFFPNTQEMRTMKYFSKRLCTANSPASLLLPYVFTGLTGSSVRRSCSPVPGNT